MSSQKFIDIDIIKLFIKGNDNDRMTIRKLYPELNLDDLREQLFWLLAKQAMHGENKVYSAMWAGENRSFVIRPVEDDLL